MALKPVSDQKLREYVLAVAAPYQGHPDYDDLLAEAFAGMWKSVCRARETNACSDRAAATNGARWAIMEFRKRWLRERIRQPLSLDENERRREEDDPSAVFPEPQADDEYEAMLTRLEAQAAWQIVERSCDAFERHLIKELVVKYRSQNEIAREMGTRPDRVARHLKAAPARCQAEAQGSCG